MKRGADSALDRRVDGHDPVPRVAWVGRVAAVVAMTVWLVAIARDPLTEMPTVLHLTVILAHEAGHVVFRSFGEVVAVAGGTIGQLLVPAICALSFARRGDAVAAAIATAWAGMSGMDVAVYAYDAADPVLPLIGGGTGVDGFHDFVYLFDRWGLLDHAHGWARAMKGLGFAVAAGALARGGWLLFRQRAHLVE